MTEERPAIGPTVEELAASRGYAGLEEVAAALGEDYTAEELRDFPRIGFGADLDRVLHLTEEEKPQLINAVVARFKLAHNRETVARNVFLAAE